MAKINGTDMTIYAGTSGTEVILWSKNCTLNTEQDLPDGTTKGSAGWAEHILGLRSWSIDFDGAVDLTGSGLTAAELVLKITARTASDTVKFGTSAAAATGFSGSGTLKNLSISAPMEDVATFSGSIVGNGPLAAI